VFPVVGWSSYGVDLFTAIFYLGIFAILYFVFMNRPFMEFKLFKKSAK
jgi:hypothetical protein